MRWADPKRISSAVQDYATAIRRRHPEVSRIFWYGSWVSGVATPSSDADICIVVRDDSRRPRDRTPEYMPTKFPVGIDLVVLTESEISALATRSPGWHRAITAGRVM